MSVTIGSARIDENGRTTGGAAGDQTGREVGTQNWYLHSKGWRVFRCKDPAKAAKIAAAMRAACANNKIGYDQNQRLTLYNQVKGKGFDPSKATVACETDCSALVRVCCAYAGIMLPDFNTEGEASALLRSGQFEELKGSKYTNSSEYLRAGDILVTKTKGHTVIVLSNGSKAGSATPAPTYKLGDRLLRNGMSGADVKELQTALIKLGYSCGSWGADGEFGDATEMAVKEFQRDHHLDIDGEVGPLTSSAVKAALAALDLPVTNPRKVKIVGGSCYIRSAPNIDGRILGVAHTGDQYTYQGMDSEYGWHLIMYNHENGWVSGKYSQIV